MIPMMMMGGVADTWPAPSHVREAERQANAATKTSFSCPSEAALAAGASSSRARGSSKLCLCSLRGFSPELHSTSTASRVPSVGTSGAESLRRHQQGLIVRALSETRRERGSFSCSIASQMAPISSASNSGAAGANHNGTPVYRGDKLLGHPYGRGHGRQAA